MTSVVYDNRDREMSRPGHPPLDKETSFLFTLWMVANQEAYRSAADRFGLSTGHAHRVFIRVCKTIYEESAKFIQWPKGEAARQNVDDFNELRLNLLFKAKDFTSFNLFLSLIGFHFTFLRGRNSFPNVFGCIDGTQIDIPCPKEDGGSYYNRKGVHALNVLAICNSKMEFTYVYSGWPGSSHDSRVWTNSPIYEKIKHEQAIPENCYLLGDSAYPIDKFMMVSSCY